MLSHARPNRKNPKFGVTMTLTLNLLQEQVGRPVARYPFEGVDRPDPGP